MTSQILDHRLPSVPWIAIAGELATALCFGCLGLFFPLLDWVKWPALLFTWHFAVVVIGTLVIAVALVRRRPEALKAAIVLAAYIGLPSLMTLSQVLVQIGSAPNGPSVTLPAMWGFGMLGQVAVILSCLGQLTPVQPLGNGEGDIQDT
ncbi:MAG TPA: hypothetical protein VGZ25_16480 [Gemmataceae bacterium]|jgi:hypothetical protein|nr:hypothetical protein [Gemmataceae bacterium]